jgi:hypothetical protein
MLEALHYLQSKGLIAHLPEVETLSGVNQPRYSSTLPRNPADAKAILMQSRLDRVAAAPVTTDFYELIDREGTGKARQHLWKYSDDDLKYITTAMAALGPEVARGRWADTKIMIINTGPANATLAPGAYVLTSAGTPRLASAAELQELEDLQQQLPCGAALQP